MRALAVLYRLQKWLWRVLRPRTAGVKVMLFNRRGELMLIRNSYGRSDLFVLPGGGIKRFESAEAAARREVLEELGFVVQQLTFVSLYSSSAEGKRDTVYLFKGVVDGDPGADGREVQEARPFALADLPAATSPATRRRIAEYVGDRFANGAW